MENTKLIRIDDLATPQLSEIQKIAVDYMEKRPLPTMTAEHVMTRAVEKTGLDDFGADDFIPRLQLWLDSTMADSGLNRLGVFSVFNDCVRYAENRLKLEALLQRHPEILEEEIEQPLIIAGLPRSGTTHLVNLIAADRRMSAIPYWEMKEPVAENAHRGCFPDSWKDDPRYSRCEESWQQQDMMVPLLKSMHPMDPDHIHEELELENLDFSSYNLEWLARVPAWRDYYLKHDQTPHYQYIYKTLQAIQWQRGEKKRWVLKSPQHMEQLNPLSRVFDDATMVITHRNPADVIVSITTMLAYGDRIRRHEIDLRGLADYWIERVEILLKACVRDHEALPKERVVDVRFGEFMADNLAQVDRVYEAAGLALNETARTDLNQFIEDHPRGKHGQIQYDLAGDFGVDINSLNRRFEFYTDKFL